MRNWWRFLSPWSIAALIVWILVLVIVANWAVPVFANAAGGALQCDNPICRTATTVEWVPILLIGATVASLVVGAMWEIRRLTRRDR